jgi:hypothetical protein
MRQNCPQCAHAQSSLGKTTIGTRALRSTKSIHPRKTRNFQPLNALDSSKDIAAEDGNHGGEGTVAAIDAATGSSSTAEVYQPSNIASQVCIVIENFLTVALLLLTFLLFAGCSSSEHDTGTFSCY